MYHGQKMSEVIWEYFFFVQCKMQTEGKMQAADYRRFNWITLPLPSLRPNSDLSINQANLSDIQANKSDI